jgi:UDP:flavonoid glycosyltransferase YjiC (YdhE family)
MAHFGLICPPGSSHVTGLTTIARELCHRGHRATVFNILDVEELATKESIAFHPVGAEHHPKGSFKAFSEKFSQLHGLKALRFGLKVALDEITMLLEEAPEAMRAAGVTAILADQGQPAASTIAGRLGVPFVTICNAVPMDPDPCVPLSATNWGPTNSVAGRLRNRLTYRTFDLATTPIRRKINSYRKMWGLKPLRSFYETFSPVLELAQQTTDFDFHRRVPPQFNYVGLIRRVGSAGVPFPFERLDGRPMVYASLGTVRTDNQGVFRMLAEACFGLDVQLVITLGGKGDLAGYNDLPGSPIVVNYVPQLALLERAALTVCHSGNNTVLESLACGVPVVAVPLNGDQYGVAARLKHSGAGERIELNRLSAQSLGEVVGRILSSPSYAERARTVRTSLEQAGGERRAADLIEQKLGKA